MLHPFLVVTFGDVVASVSTTGLLTGFGGDDGLVGAGEEVAELESLDEVAEQGGKGGKKR